VKRLQKESRKHLEKYQNAINEIRKDKKTRLEELREEQEQEIVFKVVGGEDLAVGASPALTLVDTSKPVKRKYKGFFDVD
jgi:hypothetical protein